MIALLRLFAVAIFAVLIFTFGCGYCLFSPRNPKNVFVIARYFGRMSKVFGIKLVLRFPEDVYQQNQHVYIANHQNNWDLFTISSATVPGVVTVGKKSLLWIPLFGVLYWITGNILIDRDNNTKAAGTIEQAAASMKKNKKLSIWMFPEGTRSRGRGLLPFKTGAFRTAIAANASIVPIVCSNTNNVKLNRWDNGHVIIEILPAVSVDGVTKSDARRLANICHDVMKQRLIELDQEVEEMNKRSHLS